MTGFVLVALAAVAMLVFFDELKLATAFDDDSTHMPRALWALLAAVALGGAALFT